MDPAAANGPVDGLVDQLRRAAPGGPRRARRAGRCPAPISARSRSLRSSPVNPGAIPAPSASSPGSRSNTLLLLFWVVLLLVVVGMAISFARAYTVPRTNPSARADRRRGRNRAPTEVLADGCIGHRDPDFSAEYRRGSGGAGCCQRHCFARRRSGPGAAVKRWPCAGASVRWRRRARLVLSLQGVAEERRPRDPQREPPPGARRSTRRRVCDRGHCRRTCRAAVGLRRCVVRPWCWPCSPSGPRPDRSRGGVAANRRFADAAGGDTPACPCLWLGRGPASSASGLGRWRSLAPGKGICGKTLARVLRQPCSSLGSSAACCRLRGKRLMFQAMIASGSLARIRSFVMHELRSFAPGARVVVVPQHVEKLAPGGVGGPLDVGCVDVERVMIGTGSDRAAGRAGVGDRPVSRGGAGYRLCCVPEASRTGQRTPTKHIRLRTAR